MSNAITMFSGVKLHHRIKKSKLLTGNIPEYFFAGPLVRRIWMYQSSLGKKLRTQGTVQNHWKSTRFKQKHGKTGGITANTVRYSPCSSGKWVQKPCGSRPAAPPVENFSVLLRLWHLPEARLRATVQRSVSGWLQSPGLNQGTVLWLIYKSTSNKRQSRNRPLVV